MSGKGPQWNLGKQDVFKLIDLTGSRRALAPPNYPPAFGTAKEPAAPSGAANFATRIPGRPGATSGSNSLVGASRGWKAEPATDWPSRAHHRTCAKRWASRPADCAGAAGAFACDSPRAPGRPDLPACGLPVTAGTCGEHANGAAPSTHPGRRATLCCANRTSRPRPPSRRETIARVLLFGGSAEIHWSDRATLGLACRRPTMPRRFRDCRHCLGLFPWPMGAIRWGSWRGERPEATESVISWKRPEDGEKQFDSTVEVLWVCKF
jgi:hypothetical protein